MQPVAGVVVGFDGSEVAGRAVAWGAEEAALRGSRLTIVHVRDPRDSGVGPSPDLAAAAEAARAHVAPAQIDVVETEGYPGDSLVSASQGADLLVVGRHAAGRLGAAVLGSVAGEVVARAHCPVVTVADPAWGGSGVVAGVKDVEDAGAVLATAFQEAHLRGGDLQVIHAWREPAPDRPGEVMFPVYDPDAYAAHQVERLEAAVQQHANASANVAVSCAAPHAGAVDALLDAAGGAALLVVGAPSRGPVAAMVLGSVGQALLRQLGGPVAFVPSRP